MHKTQLEEKLKELEKTETAVEEELEFQNEN